MEKQRVRVLRAVLFTVVAFCLAAEGVIAQGLQLAQVDQPPKALVTGQSSAGGGAPGQPSKEEVYRAVPGRAVPGAPTPGVSACSLCYTCGGNWPIFSGAIPTRTDAQPWERGSACAGNPTPTADAFPYLCCQ